jgi:hypothetical protein
MKTKLITITDKVACFAVIYLVPICLGALEESAVMAQDTVHVVSSELHEAW